MSWFGPLIKALDLLVVFNYIVAVFMFIWAGYTAYCQKDTFSFRMISGNAKNMSATLVLFMDFSYAYWWLRVDPMISVATWQVRCFYVILAIVGTTELIATTFSRRWELDYHRVLMTWAAGVLLATPLLMMAHAILLG